MTGLECPFPGVCVGPACHQQSAVKSQPLCCVRACVCGSLPKHSQPRVKRGRILCRADGQLILSPAERGGGEEEGQQHAEPLTQLITHSDN